MRIQQENLPYKPITIKLEKNWEAKALFYLVDKLESYINNDGAELPYNSFTREQKDLLIELSNARFGMTVSI